jgi:hypothetical protein
MFLDYAIAKSEDIVFANIRIDYNTGATLDQGGSRVVSTSDAIGIPARAKRIRVDLTFTGIWDDVNTHEGILFYDESDKFITSRLFETDDYGYIDIPDGSAKCRISLYNNEHGLRLQDDGETYELAYPEALIYYGEEIENPHYNKLTKKSSKESGQMFFRETLSGDITLHGADFDKIARLGTDDIVRFRIFALRDDSYVMFYESDIQKVGCKIDYTLGKVTLPTTALDEYTNLLSNYENEYDILKKDLPYEPISMYRKAMVQAYLYGENTVSNIIDNAYWTADTTDTIVTNIREDYHFVLPATINVESATIGKYSDKSPDASDETKEAIEKMVGKYYGYIYYAKKSDHTRYVFKNRYGYTLYFETYSAPGYYDMYYKYGDKVIASKTHWSASTEADYFLKITYADLPNDSYCYLDVNINRIQSNSVYLRCVLQTKDLVPGFEENVDLYLLSTNKTNQSTDLDPFLDSDSEYDTAIDFNVGTVITSNTEKAPDTAEVRQYGYYGVPIPICKAAWTDELSYWYVESKEKADLGDLDSLKTVKHCYSLGTVIKALLADCAPELSFEETEEYSQFLYGSTTLCSELNSLNSDFRIFLAPMTNVTKENYDMPVQKCTLTLKGVFEMLKNAYQCYPFIENGKLRFEHLIYFVRGRSYKGYDHTLDLTTLRDKFNGRHTIFDQSEVSYSIDSLNSRYEFSWADEGTDYFNDYAVDLKGGITKGMDTEQVSISTFTADVNMMLAFPGNFSDDSVAILCANKDNVVASSYLTVITPEGNSQTVGLSNYFASWLYCATLYRWYVYPSTDIEVSDNNRIAETTEGAKTADFMQVTINFPHLTNDSIANYQIKTDIGVGYVESATENLDSGIISAILNMEPK